MDCGHATSWATWPSVLAHIHLHAFCIIVACMAHALGHAPQAVWILPITTITGSAAQAIKLDLNTSTELVAASFAIYMFAVGLAALVVGPASDRFGRKPVYLVSCLAFIATSIVCIFSPSIGVLVAFRALQGFAGVCVCVRVYVCETYVGLVLSLCPLEVTDGILPCMLPDNSGHLHCRRRCRCR